MLNGENVSFNLITYRELVACKSCDSGHKLGYFQKVTISNFFGETNSESPFQHQDGIKKKTREKKDLLKSNSDHRGHWVSFTNKNCLQWLFEKTHKLSLKFIVQLKMCQCWYF